MKSVQAKRQVVAGLEIQSTEDAGNKMKVMGSNPRSWRPIFTHDRVGIPGCQYLERWIADFRLFSLRIHRWHGSDDQRHYHDHEWSFLTIVLRGAYLDISPAGEQLMKAGTFAFRKAEHKHKVLLVKKPTWTFLITGPKTRGFGFWVNGVFRKRNRYFFDHKHHPCDPPK